MRFAYADPPYIGMAHLYKDHPDYGGEVDHAALIARLVDEFPDGWALSGFSTSTRDLIAMCPPDARLMIWAQPDKGNSGVTHIAYAWEPVIMWRGRNLGMKNPERLRDFIVCPWGEGRSPESKSIHRGQKPEPFCFWLFRCLGALPGDDLVDLFPGSGAVGRAWDKYQRQMPLPTERVKVPQLALAVPE